MSDVEKYLCRVLLILVLGLLIFGMVVALAHIQEATSFGLREIINTLGLLASGIIGILSGKNLVNQKTEQISSPLRDETNK